MCRQETKFIIISKTFWFKYDIQRKYKDKNKLLEN